MSTSDSPAVHKRPALDVLAELRRGRLQNELTDGLHELIAACQETGRKGELLLKIVIEPSKVNDFETPRIEVTDQVVVKRPRRVTTPSIFFVADDGNAVRNDPNQAAFESIREVPRDITEPIHTREAN